MLRSLRQTGPRSARAATARTAPRIAPRTACERLGERQPPISERSEQSALPPATRLSGDGGKSAREADEAKRRREQAGEPADPDTGRSGPTCEQQRGSERGQHEQGDAG